MSAALRSVTVAACSVLLAFSAPSWAAPVNLGAGESIGLNFELGGSGGPYTATEFFYGGVTPESGATLSLYDGLDLTDFAGTVSGIGLIFSIGSILNQVAADGRFSVQVTATVPFVLDTSEFGFVFRDSQRVEQRYFGVPIASVPEPASLSLAGLALLGLVSSARSRSRSRGVSAPDVRAA